MGERRSVQRHRTFRAGKIFFNRGRSSIDCTVRNLSEGGALLQVTSVVDVPSTFELVMDDYEQRRQCQVVWISKDLGPSGDPSAQAVPLLRGYAHQLYASGLDRLELDQKEELYLEVAEDYAIAAGEAFRILQVREMSAKITINSGKVRDASIVSRT
jgi:hypothetical protein